MKTKEVDYPSPHKEVYIGLLMKYAGHYWSGWEEGESKVKRIFVEYMFDKGKRYSGDTLAPVYAKLENGKLILLGYDSIIKGFYDDRQEWKMEKNIQVVKINKSILNYFKMVMDFDNECQKYRDVTEQEFKDELTKALNCDSFTKEIVWVE